MLNAYTIKHKQNTKHIKTKNKKSYKKLKLNSKYLKINNKIKLQKT